ncbi:hypothetical protein AB0I60_21660 [Actinosynnema sp. NPDC050436]|uniref:hypothetical protein n=1 Tax=Actinosynnema sp. NPDC050436 TaxID=3155659 RepID=UPI00340E9C74
MTNTSRLARALGLAFAATALLAVTTTSPATAQAAAPTEQGADASPAAGGQFRYQKNSAQPLNSKLTWKQGTTVRGQWRAGSGNGAQIKNSCAKNRGWLPNGNYDGRLHAADYNGSAIKGVAWYLSDKKCHNGTLRTELFIHSEMTRNGGQQCTSRPDDPTCWEGAQDYASNGCIKLSPNDIKAADRISRQYGGPGYGSRRFPNLLVVTGPNS